MQRTVLQALRRLTLATWYGPPAVQAALGHREPIARAAAPERIEPPARSAALPVALAPAAPVRPGDPGSAPSAAASVERVVSGRALRGEVRRTADVVILGSGAGGAMVAARLAEAGREVVVLESGGLWTAAEFTERDAEMTERLYADQGLRATEDLGVAPLQGDTIGGSTTVNWMAMLRAEDACWLGAGDSGRAQTRWCRPGWGDGSPGTFGGRVRRRA